MAIRNAGRSSRNEYRLSGSCIIGNRYCSGIVQYYFRKKTSGLSSLSTEKIKTACKYLQAVFMLIKVDSGLLKILLRTIPYLFQKKYKFPDF